MTEEEIRIIVDRVFTELRNNSKTIAQLSEKTEVDNCWFEIDNGFKISLSTLKKYIAGTESINISDLSDLDNYMLSTHKGVFKVYRGNFLVGVLFMIQYQAAYHGGLQIFMSTFDYKMSGTSSLSTPSIIYRSTDYDNQKWLEWQPYQNIFISNNGQAPSTDDPLGFNDTNVVPSLRLFLDKLAYPKVVEWSGTVTDEDFTPEMSSPFIEDASLIYFSTVKKSFYVLKDGKYYNSWGGELALYLFKDPSDMKLTKNIFKGLDESVWVAVSEDSIQRIDKKDATITIDKELNDNSTNPVQNAAITKGINEAKEVILLPGNLDEITTVLSEPQIKAILGEATVLSVNKTKKVFRDASGNIVTNIAVNSSVTPYMNDCAITYVSQNTIRKIVAEYNLSTNAWNRVREIVIDSSVSLLPGDIVLPDKTTMTLESYKASGRTDAIGVVFDKHKGLYVKKDYFSGTLIANQAVALDIFYSKVKCHAPYDGRTTQKLNLLHSSNPSTEFPVFNYAEQNGLYVASNGEIEQIKKVNESLQAIESNIVSFSYIASCTQRPKATSSASVFYGGTWGASDYRDPSTALNYLLIDIL